MASCRRPSGRLRHLKRRFLGAHLPGRRRRRCTAAPANASPAPSPISAPPTSRPDNSSPHAPTSSAAKSRATFPSCKIGCRPSRARKRRHPHRRTRRRLARLGNIGEAGRRRLDRASPQSHVEARKRRRPAAPSRVKILRPGVEIEFARELEAPRLGRAHGRTHRRRHAPHEADAPSSTRSPAPSLSRWICAWKRPPAELAVNTARDRRLPRTHGRLGFTTRRVLATEWIDATPLKDIDALDAPGHDLKRSRPASSKTS